MAALYDTDCWCFVYGFGGHGSVALEFGIGSIKPVVSSIDQISTKHIQMVNRRFLF